MAGFLKKFPRLSIIDSFVGSPLQVARDRILAGDDLAEREKEWLDCIQLKVHKQERGYVANGGEHYLRVGLSAMRCIQNALPHTSNPSPNSILDFPSGYGRVLRFIQVAFPQAHVHCLELDPHAVEFCKKSFGVDSSLSQKDFARIRLTQSFDLVWCGSLITHLDENRTQSLLHCINQHLNPGGLCVFTTHGDQVKEILSAGRLSYSLTAQQIESLLGQYGQTGFGYTEYEPERDGYGFSLTRCSKIREIADKVGGWSCRRFEATGWDGHQDVYAYIKDA